VTFLVDPALVRAGPALPRDVYGHLERVVRTDLHYHYATPVCAQRWLDVCADPAYGHQHLLEAMNGAMPEVAAKLVSETSGRPLALCSLGPGDGSVDERILRALASTFEGVSYTGLDSSFELLRHTVRRLASAPGLPADLPITAVLGDFTGVRSLPAPRDPESVRLFALTGFTLGNYPEPTLLAGIGGLMAKGDYLFLDARLHPFGPLPGDLGALGRARGDLLASYDLESVRRFVFGPVEVATTAVASDVAIGFELARSCTAVPNALNLVIYCTGLNATLRLTGERVQRDRLDLAVTTSYHLPALAAWLARSGLATVWQGKDDGVAFFLLRK
jgi:hypothetical protein